MEKLNQFFGQYQPSTFGKGESVIEAEDDPTGVYYLKKGHVRLYSISPDGQELTLNIFKPGSYFSMMWAIGDIPNSYYFQAMTEIEVHRAPKEKTMEFLKSDSEVLFELTKRLLIGLSSTLNSMSYLLFGNATNKVASVLVVAAKRFGEKEMNGEIVISLPLTHQDIANMAGLTRETTSLEMQRFEQEGLIDNKRKSVVIKKFDELKKAAQVYNTEKSSPASV